MKFPDNWLDSIFGPTYGGFLYDTVQQIALPSMSEHHPSVKGPARTKDGLRKNAIPLPHCFELCHLSFPAHRPGCK